MQFYRSRVLTFLIITVFILTFVAGLLIEIASIPAWLEPLRPWALPIAFLLALATIGVLVIQARLENSEDKILLISKTFVSHNLPQPDYGNFIGREKELAQIKNILRPYPYSQEHLVTIDGIGGIGKSALALEVAHYYLREFNHLPGGDSFQAIIWTSAKDTVLTANGIRPRTNITHTLDEIFTSIAITLEKQDINRVPIEERSGLVTKALRDQRTLLIVDNLETVDDEQVITFLGELPAPTKAIVTTRHRIDVAYPVRLVGMSWEEAQSLIELESKKKG